jgi:hypothetical protein
MMPGLHGSELIKILRGQGNDVPVILMTGLGTRLLIEPMKQLGALVVTKPAAGSSELLKDLVPAVEEALKGEAELVELISRTVKLALKLGKTAPNLRWLLDSVLREQVSAMVNYDPKKVEKYIKENEATAPAENSIRLLGAIWHLRFQGESGDYPTSNALGWLYKLLATPNKLFTVAELKGDPDGKFEADAFGAEAQTDDVGIRDIKKRLIEIAEIIETTGGNESLEDDQAILQNQLIDALRAKKMDTPLKNAFRGICVQLNNLRRKLATEGMPRLAAHLHSLKKEFPFVGYYPPPGTSAWQF